jgi:hypothetical protein
MPSFAIGIGEFRRFSVLQTSMSLSPIARHGVKGHLVSGLRRDGTRHILFWVCGQRLR